jgi:hypothetical protein
MALRPTVLSGAQDIDFFAERLEAVVTSGPQVKAFLF